MDESKLINILLIGFSEPEQKNIAKLFQRSVEKRVRHYSIVDDKNVAVDILFLCVSSQEAQVEASQFLRNNPQVPLVISAKSKPRNTNYHYVPYPLRASLILSVLDQVELDSNKLKVESVVKKEYLALVIDDSAAMRKALEIELGRIPQKINVHTADCGEMALELAEKNVYDLIFLDIVMPGIDGFEVCKILRKTIKKTPIIMLTGKTSPLDEVKGVMAGCSTYLTKPVNRNEFQKVLKRVVNWLDEYQN